MTKKGCNNRYTVVLQPFLCAGQEKLDAIFHKVYDIERNFF